MLRCPFMMNSFGSPQECIKGACALNLNGSCAFAVQAKNSSAVVSQDRGSRISVPVNDLIELVKAAWMWDALEAGGVDNWEWYGESLKDAAESWGMSFGLDCKSMIDLMETVITEDYLRRTYETEAE